MKQAIKNCLAMLGMLEAMRALRAPWLRARRHAARERYYRRLVGLYGDPGTVLIESFAAHEQRELDSGEARIVARFHADEKAILEAALDRFGVVCKDEQDAGVVDHLDRVLQDRYSPPAESADAAARIERVFAFLRAITGTPDVESDRALGARIASRVGQSARGGSGAPSGFDHDQKALLQAILDRVVDAETVPKFFDYDHVDDIRGIVGGRYCGDRGSHHDYQMRIECALLALTTPITGASFTVTDLPKALRATLGPSHSYVPRRGDVTQHVRSTIPDLVAEFIALKAERDPKRFLEINREYSRRQATAQGLWDNRQLSLLRGYERNHHVMLRTLVGLIRSGDLGRDDEVLLVGPRHIDEVAFFRRHLGLPRTVGLDLFKYGKDEILAGDMHDMPFAPGRFKLVYCAGTLSYAYNARRVLDEIARVLQRPGFVFLIDAAGRHAGPDALGRSDVVNVDTLLGMFYPHAFDLIAKDAGRSLAPNMYVNEPCLALRLRAGGVA
jgi:SAM-dependent methyltransferase